MSNRRRLRPQEPVAPAPAWSQREINGAAVALVRLERQRQAGDLTHDELGRRAALLVADVVSADPTAMPRVAKALAQVAALAMQQGAGPGFGARGPDGWLQTLGNVNAMRKG